MLLRANSRKFWVALRILSKTPLSAISPNTVEVRFRFQTNPCGICGG